MSVPFGNFSSWDIRGHASGPLVADTLSASAAFSYAEREGYTVNDVTGHDLDSRGAFSGKGQLLWKPAPKWETRLIVSGERARDGDYALNDLAALREKPFHSSRDYEGFTNRDIFGTTIQAEHTGAAMRLSSTTGFVKWKTEDSTDLDYSPLPIVTRDNAEEDFQFTQEVRLASAAPKKLSDTAALKWQTGVFLFTQSYQQDAVNTLAPFVLSPFVGVPVNQYSPVSEPGRLWPWRVRPGHGDLQEQPGPDWWRACGLREQERGPQDVLRPCHRAANGCGGQGQLLARLPAVRGRLSPEAASTASTPRSRTASRPEDSTPPPLPAAKPTTKRTPGTWKGG